MQPYPASWLVPGKPLQRTPPCCGAEESGRAVAEGEEPALSPSPAHTLLHQHPPAPTHSCLSTLLGVRRLLSSRGWWHPMTFAKNMQLKEFLVYCLWCGEEKSLSLDPELHVKYPTTVLHSLATQRTSCCGGSAQDRAWAWARGGSTTETSSKDRKRIGKHCLTRRSCQRLMHCSDPLLVGSGETATSWSTQDAASRRSPRPRGSPSLPGSALCLVPRAARR